MTAEYFDSIEIPKGSGRAGFLLAIDNILKLPRVQSIQIDAMGKVSYSRILQDGESAVPIVLDFETLSPHSVIRNSFIRELTSTDVDFDLEANAAVAMSCLFAEAAHDRMFPIAFVGGANTIFWDWYTATTGIKLANHEEIFGLPFYTDRMLEDYMLFFCTGYVKGAALIETKKSYKLLLPERQPTLFASKGNV